MSMNYRLNKRRHSEKYSGNGMLLKLLNRKTAALCHVSGRDT